MTQGDNQRNVKRAYRKQAFQTGYSQITDTADATPRPLSSYSTDATQATADVLVLNVSGIAGSQSPTGDIPGPQPIPALEAMAIAPASNTTNNGENTRFPNLGGDAGTAVAGTVQRMGSDEIYRIGSFGHTELTGTDKTYQIWVDGRLFMEWSDFQWSPIVPKINQWNFDQPITVTEQIVFRVINENAALCTDTIDICFAGWSEQFTGYTDVSYQQLVPTNN